MTTVTPLNGTEVSVTLNADGLASGSARQGANVATTGLGGLTGRLDDVLVRGLFKTAAGTLGSSPTVDLWLALPATGTRYGDGTTGSDAAFTMLANPGMVHIASVQIDTANVSKDMQEFSLVSKLGFIPDSFNIVVQNNTGLALAGTAGQAVSNFVTLLPQQFTAQ